MTHHKIQFYTDTVHNQKLCKYVCSTERAIHTEINMSQLGITNTIDNQKQHTTFRSTQNSVLDELSGTRTSTILPDKLLSTLVCYVHIF